MHRPTFLSFPALVKFVAIVGFILLPFGCPLASSEQSVAPTPVDATALVRRAVQHRLDASKTHPLFQYVIRRIDERRDTTKAIIETVDGNVARLIAVNGKPLGADADKAELDRLGALAEHPELQEHRHRSEQRDADRVTHLLGLLPDGFLYKFEGLVPCPSGECYRMSFTPNPNFTPPDLEANLFRGIAGELWVDQAHERLTRLDAHFVADVDFGFGLLGRLNKGGTVLLEQSDVGGDDWELTALKIRVNGKALMVRSFNFQVAEEVSHFSPVAPGLHYRDAINLLKNHDPVQSPWIP